MRSFTLFGLEKSRFTVLAMIGLVLIASLLYTNFPKREDPEITLRVAVVTVQFSGMTPERMENLIASPVERKIREIPEVDEIKTLITTGRVSIDVALKDNVFDLPPVWQELRDKMEEVARDLPGGTSGPYVNTNFGDVSIASIALTGEGFSFREMELAAEELQRRLYTLAGIAKVELYGVQEERIWLEVDAERIATIGLQLETLVAELQAQNIILPAGSLNAAGQSILLEASGDFKSVDDVRNMLTKIKGTDDFVRLGDIVNVKRGLVSPKSKPVYFDGRPALVISTQMQSGFDIEAVGKRIKSEVEHFQNLLPIGYELRFAAFQPQEVTAAVDNAVSNVLQTVAVVLVVMALFLGLRTGLVIASIIPLAMAVALIGMNIMEIDLEQVSIAAIIISLGLLVDNGVVIVEDIARRVQLGESHDSAALQAGSQFSVPLLVSSLTTIFAFMPFFLLEGAEGEYAFSLGAVVAMTLAGSWLAAMYFLPFVASKCLPAVRNQGQRPQRNDGALSRIYQAILGGALRLPLLAIAGCYLLVVLAIMLLGKVPNEMFPLSERTQVLIYQELPKGSDISATEASALAVARWLDNEAVNPEVDNHVLYIGGGGPRFYLALDPIDVAPESAFFLVNIDNFDNALSFSDKARRHLLEQHPEGKFKIKRLSMGAGESGLVSIKISGSDLDPLLALAREVESAFREVPGLVQNENDWGEKILKVLIAIDQDKARRLGISSESMSQLLSAYFDGFSLSDYRENDQSIPIEMRAAERNRDTVDDLLNIVLENEGEAVAMEQIAKLKPQLEYSQIRRLDQVRTITITGKSQRLTAGEFLEVVEPELQQIELPPGYKMHIGGELEDSADTNQKLAAGLPAALLLMLAAVVFQFNSFRRVAIVFLSVPLIFVGVPLGLLIAGEPLSFFGTLGIISLAGIIINNAIVLIDQIDIEVRGAPLNEAIITAAAKRLRPILLTSATTVIGLVPLYLSGGSLWTPLAVVMISGLAVASLLTLVFVPASYRLLLARA